MFITIKKSFYSKIFIKVLSLIIAYSIWSVLSKNNLINKVIDIPLYFYNTNTNTKIIAPKSLKINVTGLRKNISKISFKDISAFIDAKNFHEGSYPLILSNKDLFLPDNINISIIDPKTSFIEVGKI